MAGRRPPLGGDPEDQVARQARGLRRRELEGHQHRGSVRQLQGLASSDQDPQNPIANVVEVADASGEMLVLRRCELPAKRPKGLRYRRLRRLAGFDQLFGSFPQHRI
jgi:hypothetical protein